MDFRRELFGGGLGSPGHDRQRPEDVNREALGRWAMSVALCLCFASLAPRPLFLVALAGRVVRHPLLSLDAKREILRRWACDEQLIEIAQWEGMPEGPPSRLAEVRSALLRLADEWHPHPAAPAAFAFRYEVDERLALAA